MRLAPRAIPLAAFLLGVSPAASAAPPAAGGVSWGVLIQVVADLQSERSAGGENGFSLANSRVRAFGELPGGYAYLLQANLAAAPSVIDARLTRAICPAAHLDAGLYKAPFSAEALIGAASIDFVNRSQGVRELAPARQVGAGVRLRGEGSPLSLAAGLFNGNGISPASNDDARFLYVARAVLERAGEGAFRPPELRVGLSLGYSRDRAAAVGSLVPAFDGERTLAGADFRWTRGEHLLSGEFIAARLDPSSGSRGEPAGYHLTAGRRTGQRTQLLLRWDSFRPDGLAPDSDLLLAGLNLWPTPETELQMNYVVPAKEAGFRHHQLLVNFQVGF